MRTVGPIQILIADDSPLFCRLLAKELNQHAGIHVVAKACDALRAREQILQHRPDVIILDLELGNGAGLNLLRKLRMFYPVPVIACSGSTSHGGPLAMKAMALGALEVVAKPSTSDARALGKLGIELAAKIRMAAAEAKPVPVARLATGLRPASFRAAGLNSARYLIAIGASTGGPEAIRALLANAPADFPPVVIVEHMPASFTPSFAQRLDQYSDLSVTEARDGETIGPGRAVLARGDTHLIVRRAGADWRVRYTHQQLVNRHCPSVDVLFDSVATAAGRVAVGILLTGMGDDGARGLFRMRAQGAITIAQDRASCVVYGMPKVAVELGAVAHTAHPEQMPGLVQQALLARDRAGANMHVP